MSRKTVFIALAWAEQEVSGESRMRLFTSSADTLCSVSAWLALQAKAVLKMDEWGERRVEQAGRTPLLSLEGCKRRCGWRRNAQKGGYPRQIQLSYCNRRE